MITREQLRQPGARFLMTARYSQAKPGDVVTLDKDDGTRWPFFLCEDSGVRVLIALDDLELLSPAEPDAAPAPPALPRVPGVPRFVTASEAVLAARLRVAEALLARCAEELRMIRMKDTAALYDTTLRTDLRIALAAQEAAANDADEAAP